MKTYVGGIVWAAVATIVLAHLLALSGHNMIGYSFETRFVVGGIFGSLVGVLAGLPRLVSGGRFGSRTALMLSAMSMCFLLWIAECIFLPGTNNGVANIYAAIALLTGMWIGFWMWAGDVVMRGWKSFLRQISRG